MPSPLSHRLVAVVLLTLATIAAACVDGEGGGAPAPIPTPEATTGAPEGFSIYTCPPRTLLPTDNQGTCGAHLVDALFTGLVQYDPATSTPRWGDECTRCMAASVESDDATTWTITIKEGWRFHDGEEITARTFVDSWNFAAYGPNQQANSFLFTNVRGFGEVNPGGAESTDGPDPTATPPRRRLAGLEVLDQTSFRVRLQQPFSHYPVTLGHRGFSPLPSSARQDPEGFLDRPVGNGPFEVVEQDGVVQEDAGRGAGATGSPSPDAATGATSPERIELRRHPGYAGEPAAAERATFVAHGAVHDAYDALVDGDLDVMADLPASELTTVEETFGERYVSRTGGFYHALVLPSTNEELANDDIGRALSMAVDREEIAREVLGGTVTPARGLAPPVVLGARPDPCGEGCEFRPRQARRLFERAGGLSRPPTIWFNSGAGLEAWIEAIAEQWEEHLGIEEVRLRPEPFGRYLELLGSGDIRGPYRLGWAMDYPSLLFFLEPLHARGGRINFDGYTNQRAERLIARGNAAGSVQAALDPFRRAEQLILEDWHHIPLWFSVHHLAHSPRVEEVGFDPFGQVRVADVRVAERG